MNRCPPTILAAEGIVLTVESVVDNLINSGVVNNAGTYTANVQNSSPGVITNQLGGTWIGNVTSNTGTVANMGTWTGTVSNAATFNNNVGGAVSGHHDE